MCLFEIDFVSYNVNGGTRGEILLTEFLCRAWAVNDVLVQQIRNYAIGYNKAIECFDTMLMNNVSVSAWLFSCSPAGSTTSTTARIACE